MDPISEAIPFILISHILSWHNNEGIQYFKEITPGAYTFSVNYKDKIVHKHFVGHDVNLVIIEDNSNLDTLEAGMNWSLPTVLISSVP